MLLISLALLGADLGSPVPLEQRVTALEAKVASLESKVALCQCWQTSKSPVAAKAFFTPADDVLKKSADAPTYHFPDNTKCTVDQFGNVTCSNQPTTMSYPGGPYRQAIQQGSGDCSDGSCQPQQRRGVFRGGLFKRRWGT